VRIKKANAYLLVVGGPADDVPGFLDFLPRHLRSRVAGTFTIDPDTAATDIAGEHAEQLLERYVRDRQREQVAELLAESAWSATSRGWLAQTGERCPMCGRKARHTDDVIGHPIVQSFEPGEDWRRCYLDETYV
jgi:hypothetical protein